MNLANRVRFPRIYKFTWIKQQHALVKRIFDVKGQAKKHVRTHSKS